MHRAIVNRGPTKTEFVVQVTRVGWGLRQRLATSNGLPEGEKRSWAHSSGYSM